MVDVFQKVLLYAALAGLALALTLLAVRSETLRIVQARILSLWSTLTPSGRVISVSLLAISVLYGGGKTNSLPRMMTRSSAPTLLTYAQKKAQNWNIRGAWKDSFWLKFADTWRFPCGTNHLRGVEVISYGELWQTPFDNNAVASLGAPAEIVPTLSSFLYELTPSNSYRFVWENAAIARDTNNLLTASLELFRNGDILTVTNGVATYKERKLPTDWGDPNEDGFYGNDNTLPVDADEDAYYWIDLVVSNATAKVLFAGDKPSNYPDPEFIAKYNETNRVYLLIGKKYTATSDETIRVVSKSSGDIIIDSISDKEIDIVLPVEFFVTNEDEVSNATSRAVTQVPIAGGFKIMPFPFLKGYYVWNTNEVCCITHSSKVNDVWLFSCNKECNCMGCSFNGTFHYEGYYLDVLDVSCGCSFIEKPSATASISFSKSAVIFENCYTNAPNDIVPRRSTTNSLDITIYGGPFGGSAEVEFDDKGKLEYLTQDAIPRAVSVAAEQTLELSFPFIAKEESVSENDIKARLKFSENFTGDIIENEDEMTAVRVEVETAVYVPIYRNRHYLGVGEIVRIYCFPRLQNIIWTNGFGRVLSTTSEYCRYDCAHIPCADFVGIQFSGVRYCVDFSVVAPMSYQIHTIATNYVASIGQSGGFVAELYGSVLPKEVSFENVEIIEIPCVSVDAVGYYAQPSKVHLHDHGRYGAGVWVNVEIYNQMYDCIAMEINSQPWSDGEFSWPIPNAWRVKNDLGITNVFCNTDQRFRIFSSGKSSIEKFGILFESFTNGVYQVISP